MQFANLTKEQTAAVLEFLQRSVVPVVAEIQDEGKEKAVIAGTGSLFSTGEKLYFIGAAHVVRYIVKMPDKLGIPVDHLKGGIYTFNESNLYWPGEELRESFDIAVLELQDKEVTGLLRKAWNVQTPDDIAFDPSSVEEFVVAGFPDELSKYKDENLSADMLVMNGSRYTGSLEYVDPKPDPSIHVLIEHNQTALLRDGTTVACPHHGGISGCPIWALVEESEDALLWTPRENLRMVGVQRAYIADKFIVGTKWIAVAELIKESNPDGYDLIMASIKQSVLKK